MSKTRAETITVASTAGNRDTKLIRGIEPAVVLDARVVTGAGGGPDKTILKSPKLLEPAGYRVVCAYLRPPGDPGFAQLQVKAETYAAPLVAVDDRGPLDWRVVPRMLDVCRRERVTIWHGHDYKTNLLGLILARRWPMRLVTTVHGWVQRTRKTPLYYAVDRICLPRYERVICVSNDLHAASLAAGVDASRCLLLENGVDAAEFNRRLDPPTARRMLGLNSERPLIGGVGRLSGEKGFDVLIRAAARLMGQGLEFDVAIAGEGGEGPALRALVGEFGLSERIHLLGYRADVAELLQAMDVFALSSIREGLPNVVLEAMACEVPVVATRVAGVPGLIDHGTNGLLIDPGSEPALAGAMALLLGDADRRAALGRAGRATVESRYSFEGRTRKLRGIYDEMLGSAAPFASR